MNHIWQKGDSGSIDRSWFEEFTTAEDRKCDTFLIPADILGNIAQAWMLHKIGILNNEEVRSITASLRKYYALWEEGSFGLTVDDEDVHSAIEKHLTKDCGEAGKKIHTGRSRNDQVQTDIRLFLKSRILSHVAESLKVLSLFEKLIQENPNVFFTGFTHTQPAMPTSVDAWCAGFMDLLISDLRSLVGAYHEIDVCPLGSAAGFGTPYFNLDRQYASDLLGFRQVQYPVTAVQLGRGVLEKRIVDALGYQALTWNRLASDIIFFANPMLGLVHLSDAQTSGSSIMPQKRNPDAWELIRGSYSWYQGWSTQLGGVGANLISGYHRDLQITKKVVFDAIFHAEGLLTAVRHALSGVQFLAENCTKSLLKEVFATHVANELVAEGIPFREAYKKAAASVEKLHIPDTETLKASYKVEGNPGRFYAPPYLDQKREIEEWVHAEEEKQKKFKTKLLHEMVE